MWNLKYDTNEHIYETGLIYRHREQLPREEGVGEEWIESLGLEDASYYT